jgi:hypothetical protein
VAPTIPAIPVATDMASAIQAINTMRQIIQAMTNQTGGGGGGGPGTVSTVQANFQENKSKRVVQTVRVYNPNDKTQFVDVKQITGLTFENRLTKQTITWAQGAPINS